MLRPSSLPASGSFLIVLLLPRPCFSWISCKVGHNRLLAVDVISPACTYAPSRPSVVCSIGVESLQQRGSALLMSMFQDNYEDEYDEDDNDGALSDEDLVNSMGTFDERIPKLNTIHLTGRVGNDPEPRYFDDGKVVVSLSLASRRKLHWEERQAFDVQWGEEETDWYTLEVWSGLAEFVSKFVDKGARIGVIGSLQEDEFADKETGEKVSRVKVIVRELDILESKSEAELRRANKGQSRPSFQSNGGRREESGWPSSAGSGDFF